MSKNKKHLDLDILDMRNKILTGLNISLQRLIKDKRSKNMDLTFSEKGKVIHVKAADL